MFRKIAEVVYSKIIDSYWLRIMVVSSKDGFYIGEIYVIVIYLVILVFVVLFDNYKFRGVLNIFY